MHPNTINAIKKRMPEMIKKSRETLLKRYNISSPSQLPDHKSKIQKSRNNITVKELEIRNNKN